MYIEEEEIRKIEKRKKIVDVIFFISMISWSLIWLFWIHIKIIRTFDNAFAGFFISVIVLAVIDFTLAKFFIWLSGEVGRVKRVK